MIRRIAEDMRRKEAEQRREAEKPRKLTKKEKKRLRYERMWASLLHKAATTTTTKSDFLQRVTSAARGAE